MSDIEVKRTIEKEGERQMVAYFAGWCVGSCYGDWDTRTKREQERVLKDDSVYAVWRERWIEYTTAKQRGGVSGDLCGDPVKSPRREPQKENNHGIDR